jgi:hypothetical protein
VRLTQRPIVDGFRIPTPVPVSALKQLRGQQVAEDFKLARQVLLLHALKMNGASNVIGVP